MAENQNQKDFKLFAQNLRTTAVGAKFAKTLFTNPGSLTTQSIMAAFKALGLPITQEVQITAEMAQIIVSGQTINSGLQAGKSVSDLSGAVNTSMASFKALSRIAETNGWLDSDTASVIQIGTSITMIVNSAGTNVAAWISLCLDLAQAQAQKQGLADMRAIINAQDLYRARVSPQAKILGETFKDFQEKKISVYGMIAKMAVETPDLWPQVINQDSPFVKAFPDLMMLPVVPDAVEGYGSAEIRGNWPWPARGSYVIARWNSYKSIDFQTLGTKFDRELAAEYFFESLIRPWVACYAIANQEIVGRGNMSMESVAAISYLVNPSGEISDTDDYVKMLMGSNLTPFDLGDNILANIGNEFVEAGYVGRDVSFQECAVSIGISPKNLTFNAYQKDKEIMRQKLEQVKNSNDISVLVQYPYIYKKLQSYMDFEQVSFEKDPSYGGRLNGKFSENSVRAWRKLHNYIAVIQMMDTFRKDSYLSQTRFAQQLMPFMPSVDAFSDKVDYISYLSTTRAVNKVATLNIASLLGTTPDKLIKLTPDDYVGPVRYEIK